MSLTDGIYVGIAAVVLLTSLSISYTLASAFSTTQLGESPVWQSVFKVHQILFGGATFFVMSLVVVAAILAYRVPTHPIFLPISILMLLISLVVSYVMSVVGSAIASAFLLPTDSAYLVGIVENLPVFVLIASVIIAGVMYGRYREVMG